MATVAREVRAPRTGDRFHFNLMAAMALVLVAAFSMNLAMGRSTFGVPLIWHVHAVIFFGWVVIALTQSWLATHDGLALHRRLGWIAALWVPLMVAAGIAVTVATVRRGTAPFFFQPQHFLIANPLALLCVAGLIVAAIVYRRDRATHRALQICAFAGLLGPGFGRLLPAPLLMPYAYEIPALVGLAFPLFAMRREKRLEGRVSPAWWWGMGAICAVLVVAGLLARSPVGANLYAWTVAGTPAAQIDGLAYGKPPPGM